MQTGLLGPEMISEAWVHEIHFCTLLYIDFLELIGVWTSEFNVCIVLLQLLFFFIEKLVALVL